MAIIAECPSCGESISFARNPKLGQEVRCSECDTDLEVVGLDPVELDWTYDDEDWDDDDWDDDDEG